MFGSADMEKRGGGQAVAEFPSGLDWLNSAPLKFGRWGAPRGAAALRLVAQAGLVPSCCRGRTCDSCSLCSKELLC